MSSSRLAAAATAATAAAVVTVALAKYLARQHRAQSPEDEHGSAVRSQGEREPEVSAGRSDSSRSFASAVGAREPDSGGPDSPPLEDGLDALEDSGIELVPTPPKSASQSPASPNMRRRQQADITKPASHPSTPESLDSSPSAHSRSVAEERQLQQVSTNQITTSGASGASTTRPLTDHREAARHFAEIVQQSDEAEENPGTVEIMIRTRKPATRAAPPPQPRADLPGKVFPSCAVPLPDPIDESQYPTHYRVQQDTATSRHTWRQRRQRVGTYDELILAREETGAVEIGETRQRASRAAPPMQPRRESLDSDDSPSQPAFPRPQQDQAGAKTGTCAEEVDPRFSDLEQTWDDAFFSTLYSENTPRISSPGETLSTSFYTPIKQLDKSKDDSAKFSVVPPAGQGSLGVRIKDSSFPGVVVSAVLPGGLIWRQGQIKSGDRLLSLNGTTITGCDHLNELMATVSRAEPWIPMT